MINNSQKGVSLIITFFISIIILFIVLSISTLLYSEIKVIRNMGNSMNAFYAAESGVEKVLYYDRKEKVGETRGICNICTSESGVSVCPDCLSCVPTGSDCTPETCSDCKITFSTEMGEKKRYEVDATVNQRCKISNISLNSYGFYQNVSRAINFGSDIKVSSIVMSPSVTADVQNNGVNMTISVAISDPDGIDGDVTATISGVGAEIYNQCDPTPPQPFTQCIYREVTLEEVGNTGTYGHTWNFGKVDENYTINIFALDNLGYCVQASNVSITYE